MVTAFSIITVTFNDCPGLKITYESIISQIFQNFEWIVIDGNSEDDTVMFLESVKREKTIWISERDTGIYDAMNKGINLASGEYTVFLNSGDYFPGEMTLGRINSFIAENSPVPDVILGGASFILPNNISQYKPPRKIENYIWHGVPANHQATYFKTDLIKGILYDTKYKICGDYYIIARISLLDKCICYFDVPVVNFIVGGTSYRRIPTLWKESYMVKRDVLNLSFYTKFKSLIKSIISTIGLIILSQPRARWLAMLIIKHR